MIDWNNLSTEDKEAIEFAVAFTVLHDRRTEEELSVVDISSHPLGRRMTNLMNRLRTLAPSIGG